MTEYVFKMAQSYQLPFACERRRFADDASAVGYVPALASSYPSAATITVAVEPRTVERVQVNTPVPDDHTLRMIRESRALIAASRHLLAEPANQAPAPLARGRAS